MQKNNEQQFPEESRRDGWDAEKVSKEAVNQSPDETVRQMLRGDETEGEADNRDIAGSPDKTETPQGREEAKPNSK